MRLLDVRSLTLHTFYGDNIPPYAILSHTWLQDNEEVTFAQFQGHHSRWSGIVGAQKIFFLCRQAAEDGFRYAWMDTCCIDKTNSSELSEAINSMFNWYKESEVCYAYLVDVDQDPSLHLMHSRWWSRAWTLQELLAPAIVKFYDKSWKLIGTKNDLGEPISTMTGIDQESLWDPQCMYDRSIAQRMSWAASRQATRTEDLAYSLLGIFEINMPLQYGEGERAFLRLQKEILKTTNDQSLFAWGLSPRSFQHALQKIDESSEFDAKISVNDPRHARHTVNSLEQQIVSTKFGMFASHPRLYAHCRNIEYHGQYVDNNHIDERHGSLYMEVPLIYPIQDHSIVGVPIDEHSIALLPCSIKGAPHYTVAIVLRNQTNRRFAREGLADDTCSFLINSREAATARTTKIMVPTFPGRTRMYGNDNNNSARYRTLICEIHTINKYNLFIPGLPPNWTWNAKESALLQDQSGARARIALKFVSEPQQQQQPPTVLIIAVQLGSEWKTRDRVIIYAQTASDTTEDVVRVQHKIISLLASNLTSSLCHHGSFYAAVTTRRIFNQAVSTLTITDNGDSVEQMKKDHAHVTDYNAIVSHTSQ